jgi:hypothetical protein
MSDETPTPLPGVAVPWYQSAVQKAQMVSAVTGAIALFPKLGTFLGIHTPEQIATWVETIFGFATLAAPIVGMVWRAASHLQPLTWTKKAAVAAAPIPIQTTPAVVVKDPKEKT